VSFHIQQTTTVPKMNFTYDDDDIPYVSENPIPQACNFEGSRRGGGFSYPMLFRIPNLSREHWQGRCN
jgi:hypothetical protein